MGFIKLEDLTGTIPVTFFPQNLKACEQLLVKDKIVLIKGRACHRERIAAEEDDTTVEVEIRGESVTPMKNGNGHSNIGRPRSVHIKINGTPAVKLDFLKRLLESSPGESPVFFHMCHGDTRQKVSTSYKVDATTDFVSQIERILGREVVKVG
jgi:DNA polymerase III alpha subunit